MMENRQYESALREPEEEREKDEKSSEELSPEEQMAKFEEEMKNEDWGHQPC